MRINTFNVICSALSLTLGVAMLVRGYTASLRGEEVPASRIGRRPATSAGQMMFSGALVITAGSAWVFLGFRRRK